MSRITQDQLGEERLASAKRDAARHMQVESEAVAEIIEQRNCAWMEEVIQAGAGVGEVFHSPTRHRWPDVFAQVS